MKVILTENQLMLALAIDACETRIYCLHGAKFELEDELRVLADKHGVSELAIGVADLVAKLEVEHAG